MNLLLPHYFHPKGDGLNHEKIITELLSGMNNSMEWRKDMGFVIQREKFKKMHHQSFEIHPPSRYEDLWKNVSENNEFWGFLATCNIIEMTVNFEIFSSFATMLFNVNLFPRKQIKHLEILVVNKLIATKQSLVGF